MKRSLHANFIDSSERESPFWTQCREFILHGLTDSQFGVELLAEELNMSHSALYKKIKRLSGFSPNELIRQIRIEQAAEMLSHGQLSVKDVASYTGFRDLKYFRRHFKRVFHFSPSMYKKRQQRAKNFPTILGAYAQSYVIWKENAHLKTEEILPICPS